MHDVTEELGYLIAGTEMQGVIVDCAILPVLDLHEARAFGGATVLQSSVR